MRIGRRARGFTLLEMLVVVVIIGIVMGAVVVQAAHDEARLRSQPIVWEATPEGYRFLIREHDAWQPLRDDVLRAGQWRQPLSALSLMQVGRPAQSGSVRVLFGREAIEAPITLRMAVDAAQVDIVTTGPSRYVVQ